MQKKLKYKKIKLFIDFDGTITTKDIGNDFFMHYLGVEQFQQCYNKLVNSEVDIKTYWRLVAEKLIMVNNISIVNNQIILPDFDKYIANIEIDNYFTKFIELIEKINHNFTVTNLSESNSTNLITTQIISDGFDIYIRPILDFYNINIKYYANKLTYNSTTNQITPIFNLENEGCKCSSASCKQNLMLQIYQEDNLLIYIGDGASDYCPVEKCDIVFAKGKLSKYCNENNIPHYNFQNFFEIMSIFNKMFIEKKIPVKIRNHANIKRKLVFEIE